MKKNKNTSLAPIALFAFNRPEHLTKTIEALKKNTLASESLIFVFIDGAKDNDTFNNNLVKEISYNICGFKNVQIIERQQNLGLRQNIIDGVSYIFKKFEKIIVLEDDIVTSNFFLEYMNQALVYYKSIDKVWHISGYNDPIDLDFLKEDVFLLRAMNCWGWASWKEKWDHYEKNPLLLKKTFTKEMIKNFNLDNTLEMWSQVEENYIGKIDTWAIFWYATIFINEGLCVIPKFSYVKNIGRDGSGANSMNTFEIIPDFKLNKNKNKNIKFIDQIKENDRIAKILISYFKKSKKNILYRAVRKLFRLFRNIY